MCRPTGVDGKTGASVQASRLRGFRQAGASVQAGVSAQAGVNWQVGANCVGIRVGECELAVSGASVQASVLAGANG